jgi:hypothetical protein
MGKVVKLSLMKENRGTLSIAPGAANDFWKLLLPQCVSFEISELSLIIEYMAD